MISSGVDVPATADKWTTLWKNGAIHLQGGNGGETGWKRGGETGEMGPSTCNLTVLTSHGSVVQAV
jgi:hypothetical protein